MDAKAIIINIIVKRRHNIRIEKRSLGGYHREEEGHRTGRGEAVSLPIPTSLEISEVGCRK